jgi:hypothetical protein
VTLISAADRRYFSLCLALLLPLFVLPALAARPVEPGAPISPPMPVTEARVLPAPVDSGCGTQRISHRVRTFRGCSFPGARAQAENSARAFLNAHGKGLGLDKGGADLDLVEIRQGLASTHSRFRQRAAGLPVFQAHVSVHQGTDGSVRSVNSTYVANASPRTTAQPGLTAAEAESAAIAAIAKLADGIAPLRLPTQAELVWFRQGDDDLVLGWKLTVFSANPLGDFLTVIDAGSGAVLFMENRMAFVTGSGYAYLPNPVQVLGDWTSISDNSDATGSLLDQARDLVTLQGLDAATGLLMGEFVDLTLAGGLSVPAADEVSRSYLYDRDEDRFEQVLIYHAVDSIQRYFHSLGFDDDTGIPNGIRDFPTLANAHWFTDDQSFYSTGDDAIHFGDGGVDDGEDADIVVHEYGHAVQHNQNSLWGGGEMGAMGEGFGDYLAASYHADIGEAAYQALNAPCVGEWDATSYSGATPPCLRRTDGSKHYPEDLVGQVHADGEIWSAALWEIRLALGGVTTDQLVLEHHFALPGGASMEIAALELIDADLNLNGGSNDSVIRQIFCDRGILAGTDCQPALPTPTFTYPAGGETLSGGSTASVSWETLPEPEPSAYYDLWFTDSCTPGLVLDDDMESGSALWSVAHGAGTLDWALGTTNPRSGSYAWFASDPATLSDQYLALLGPVTVPTNGQLGFWHRYTTEAGFDGGVVEISTDGVNWQDLGPSLIQNGYNSTISTVYGSPIGGRAAFSGSSGSYVETLADLGGYAGQSVYVRFRMASDSSVSSVGWYVDDVSISSASTWTAIGTTGAGASSFPWSVPAVAGNDYCLRIEGMAHGYSNSPQVVSGVFSVALDGDGDGVPDSLDNCPATPNADQADKDGNDVGDVCEPPRVTGIWASASVVVGDTISLFVFGDYFDLTPGATQVIVNGVQQFIVQVVTPEMLIARVTVTPAMLGGPVTVNTPEGTAQSVTNFGDTLTGVSITGIWPASASVGDFVFVFGSGYAFPISVSIGATPAPLIQVVSPDMFILIVPPSASTGPVSVTTPGGSATSSEDLVIVP